MNMKHIKRSINISQTNEWVNKSAGKWFEFRENEDINGS